MAQNDWESVIGLEIHAQLQTKTKMFSPDEANFGAAENSQVHPVSLGLPGALPSFNEKGLELSILTGLALNCEIRKTSVFARKNYFYPDLPKGYQISQFDKPLCEKGWVAFRYKDEERKISIERAHLEEDAGKSTHQGEYTLIDLNRSGVPLLEIVSGPDMTEAAEAAEYAKAVRQILLYLGVCDGNLEEGSMRCDCNVSVRKKGVKKLGTKVELKNINSFRFIEKAIDYEIQRQIDTIEDGGVIVQETRLYDSTKNRTFAMRKKEEAHDYRYFPDPDLLPVQVTDEKIEAIRSTLPELPKQKAERFQKDYGLPEYDAGVLTQDFALAKYFEKVAEVSGEPKAASNWVMGELLRDLNEAKKEVVESPVAAESLGELVGLISKKEISGKMGKTVFQEMWKSGESPEKIVSRLGLSQITDPNVISKMIEEVIAANPGQLEQYRGGKVKLFGFFVGQAMKASKGQANPELLNKILKEKLDS